jgi:23S rRNA (adenine1618-N6)-methyltransferase
MNIKNGLHPRNKHKSEYNFTELLKAYPELLKYIIKNKSERDSINFSDSNAVLALNSALLKFFYKIDFWSLPKGFLCPPIPGRADYIHHLADLLKKESPQCKILDIGVGANCIYPLIATREYQWLIVGSDIESLSLKNAQLIIDKNKLSDVIELRLQKNKKSIFEGIVKKEERFTACISNPPFFESLEKAKSENSKKNKNLGIKTNKLNFGGAQNELWCEGGELQFITQMIHESIHYKNNFSWFTSLVSKSATLPFLYDVLKHSGISKIRTIDMAQGQKKSRILAWRF